MKFTKVLTKFILGAALAVLCASTAFAATKGWNFNEEKQGWQYIDNYETPVCDEWKMSNGKAFYLNSDGFMATNTLIESDGCYKYVGEDGAMVTNIWKKLATDADEDARWMYFQNNGKSVVSGWKTINNKSYHFTDSKMDYGFLAEDGSMLEDSDNAWKNATYWCGSEDDGARYSGWLKVDDTEAASDSWCYFWSNGKKVIDTTKTINGNKYRFDENGKMVTEWYATPSTATAANYFNEDGTLKKAGWVYTTAKDDEDGEKYWFYAKNNGEIYHDTIVKINNKYYAFDSEGKMMTGFVKVDADNKIPDSDNRISKEDATEAFAVNVGEYMYFAESEDPNQQGWASTGKTVIEIYDGKKTFNFNSRGVAYSDGDRNIKGYHYCNGILQTDEDCDYKYDFVIVEGHTYVRTNATGKISNKGTFTDSANDRRYKVENDTPYISYRKDNKWGDWELGTN